MDHPLGDAVEVFVRREDADRFIKEVRGDDLELASYLRIEERELEPGGRNLGAALRPGRSFHPLYSAPVEIDQSHLVREPFQVAYALERGDESYVDVPVLTEIEPGLWFGGAPEPRAPEGFDFIVNLVAAWARYDPNGIECVNVTVEDGEVTAEVAKQFGGLAHEVNRRRDLGQTILVHCQVGLNRSATVVALALMLRGMAAFDAIRLLREKRHRLVICNPHFERWLLDRPAVALDPFAIGS